MSPFRICIIRADSEPVFLRPDSIGERDLIAAIKGRIVTSVHEHIKTKDVGFFCTQENVEQALLDGLDEVIAEGITDVIYALKAEVQPT